MKSLSSVIKESMDLTEGFNPNKMYIDGKGKYQKEYDTLYDELVPVSGEANTPEGEALRCAGKIYYENMNNGNCNAVPDGPRGRYSTVIRDDFQDALDTLDRFFQKRHNKAGRDILMFIQYEVYYEDEGFNSAYDEQFERLMDLTIEEILKSRK